MSLRLFRIRHLNRDGRVVSLGPDAAICEDPKKVEEPFRVFG